MRVHILDDWLDTLRHLPCFRRLDGHDVTVWTDAEPDAVRLSGRICDAEALVMYRERTPITAGLVAALPSLRMVSGRGPYPHVDLPALTRRGVVLCSDMDAIEASTGTAELTLTLILAALRDLANQMDALRAGRWQTRAGRSAAGLRLGLYGYGSVARQVADFARALGMKVWWHGSERGRVRALANGEEVAPDREAFFSRSDVVSLHLRLVAETAGIVTPADLALMKPDAVLVNTARAGLIVPSALAAALDAGRPGMAALDVFDIEPVDPAHEPLAWHEKVIATPHIGFVTTDMLDATFDSVFAQVASFAAGAPVNVVNPEAMAHGRDGG